MSKTGRVLVIGSGGREHALALRLLDSESVQEVVVSPGNPGTSRAPADLARLGKRLSNLPGDPVERASELLAGGGLDLAVIGPEAPLCAGLSDRLTERGVLTFGPDRRAAQLEGSKAFMKEFAQRHGIRTARHRVVSSTGELETALSDFSEVPVVKADGLCAGKGVVVAHDWDEARVAAQQMLEGKSFGAAGQVVVLEERVTGFEASVHAVCDGERMVVLPPAQDHKRLKAGDQGPNTGGMGTFAPTPRLSAALMQRITAEVLQRALVGMAEEGMPFRGTLFAGLMLSDSGEPTLLEFNVRFGDPETQVLMGLIDGDLGLLLSSAAEGRLDPGMVSVKQAHAVCIVLAAAGYPVNPRQGDVISGIEQAEALGARVYHAGTRSDQGQLSTAGGRVLGVTAQGVSLAEARGLAYRAVECIQFDGKQWRDDIGC